MVVKVRIWLPARSHRLRWCLIPLIVIVTAAMTLWFVPLRLRFALGESELERFAQEVIAETTGRTPRQTSQFASTARQSSCSHGRFIFVCTSLSTNPWIGYANPALRAQLEPVLLRLLTPEALQALR